MDPSRRGKNVCHSQENGVRTRRAAIVNHRAIVKILRVVNLLRVVFLVRWGPLGNLQSHLKTSISLEKFREIPPGLLQHVLIVLVFWSWVLLLPRLPPWSRSLRLFPWASILLYGPVDIAWICCPQLPHHPCKNGTHSTCFYSTGGHTLTNSILIFRIPHPRKKNRALVGGSLEISFFSRRGIGVGVKRVTGRDAIVAQ